MSAPPTQPPIPDGELRRNVENAVLFAKTPNGEEDIKKATDYIMQLIEADKQADRKREQDRLYTALEAKKHTFSSILSGKHYEAVPIEAINKVLNRNGAQ